LITTIKSKSKGVEVHMILSNYPKLVVGFMLIIMLVFGAVSAEENTGQITLHLAHWDGPGATNPVPKIVERFMEDHPNINVEIQFGTGDYFSRIIVDLVSGTAPDVFLWWDYPMIVQEGFLEDLTPFLEKSDILSPDMYFPQVRPYSGLVNGVTYGLPHSFSPRAILYNMDRFDEGGVLYPESDWTWEEFRSIAKKLTDPEKSYYGFSFDTGIYGHSGYIWSGGGQLISEDGRQVDGFANSQDTIDAYQWLADLRTKDMVVPFSGALPQGAGFATGHIAMVDAGHWALAMYPEQNPNLRFGAVLPPRQAGKELQTVIHSSGWVVCSLTKYPDEAVKLLEYLCGPIGHSEVARIGWALPCIPEVADEFGFWNDDLKLPFLQSSQHANNVHYFLRNPIWSNTIEPILQRELDTVFNGDRAAQTALNAAVQAAQAILDRQK
jgi:multiple sugar transport system substrate-binding protein